jgi:hypothetical protein
MTMNDGRRVIVLNLDVNTIAHDDGACSFFFV